MGSSPHGRKLPGLIPAQLKGFAEQHEKLLRQEEKDLQEVPPGWKDLEIEKIVRARALHMPAPKQSKPKSPYSRRKARGW